MAVPMKHNITKKHLSECFDCAMRHAFMEAFRGKTKGHMESGVRRRIDRALKAIKEAGYARQ